MHCWNCRNWTDEDADRCDNCGLRPSLPDGAPDLYSGLPLRPRYTAAFMALLIGMLGVHKFYLGYNTQGAILAGLTFTFALLVPATTYAKLAAATTYAELGIVLMMMFGMIEGVIYLLNSDRQFYETYVINRRAWF